MTADMSCAREASPRAWTTIVPQLTDCYKLLLCYPWLASCGSLALAAALTSSQPVDLAEGRVGAEGAVDEVEIDVLRAEQPERRAHPLERRVVCVARRGAIGSAEAVLSSRTHL